MELKDGKLRLNARDLFELEVIKRLGVDPKTVAHGSVEVHRFESGKPSIVTYTVMNHNREELEALDDLEEPTDYTEGLNLWVDATDEEADDE